MANVFISYSSKHRDLTRALAGTLRGQNLTVWWDDDLEARGPFEGQIHAELAAAQAVVVIWTVQAAVSDWVKAEAHYAFRHHKLINVLPEGVPQDRLPLFFQNHHRHGPLDHDKIRRDVLAVMAGRPLPTQLSLRAHYENDYREPLLDPKQLPLLPMDRPTPALLLQAKHKAVDFIDVHGLRDRLVDWALGEGEAPRTRPVAGRLMVAPGGLGKTRLMIEVAARLREAGWSAGFFDPAKTSSDADRLKRRCDAMAQLIDGGDDKGLLVVLDYAAGRDGDVIDLAVQMRQAARTDSDRPRILMLLAREAGEWWEMLQSKAPILASLFGSAPGNPAVIEIANKVSSQHRRVLFDEARAKFAALLRDEITVNEDPPREDRIARLLRDPVYDRPLAVLMEALLHVYAEHTEDEEAGMARVLDGILNIEWRHWEQVEGNLTSGRRREMIRGTAQVTLVGGTNSPAESAALLLKDTYYAGARPGPYAVEETLRSLAHFYGNGSGGLNPLEPDLIGEHLVVSEAKADLTHACRLIDACLGWQSGGTARWNAVLTVLNRATKPEHGAKAALAERLLAHVVATYAVEMAPTFVTVALKEPDGRLPEALSTALAGLEGKALAAIGDALAGPSVRLLDAKLAYSTRRRTLAASAKPLRHKPQLSDEEAARLGAYAAAVGEQGVDLFNLDRREQALAASQEAVDIYRTLAKDRPDAFLPDLASSLNNTGAVLSNLGRDEQALASSEEAVDIRRALAKDRPNAFLPDLAASLNNFGNRLSNRGRHEQALTVSQEAVAIRRALAKDRPDAFLPGLARSLNNISVDFSNLGRHEQALAASQEAVAIRRALAKDRPDVFLPDLARSLNNLGGDLSNLGRREQALAALQEAVGIYRALAKDRPDAFLPDLATSLGGLSRTLAATGRHADAAEAARQGLVVIAPLVEGHPEAFGELGRSLRRDYLEACEKAGIDPDRALLQRVARALGDDESNQE